MLLLGTVTKSVIFSRDSWMKCISFLFQSCPGSKHVMSFRLFPQIVKLNEVTDSPRLNLTQQMYLQVLAMLTCENRCSNSYSYLYHPTVSRYIRQQKTENILTTD